MTYFADEASAATAVRDPATSRADLMSIAYAYPVLGAEVARHPNAYPGLLDWLEQFGTPKARAEVAAVRAETPPPIYRASRQDVDAMQDTVLSAPAAAAAPKVTPAPAPAPAPVAAPAPAPAAAVNRTEVPTVPVVPAVSRIDSAAQSAMADAPTDRFAAQTAPVVADTMPLAAHTASQTKVDAAADYVSPFDEYSDEPEPRKPAAEDSDFYKDKPWSKAKKAIVFGGAALVVVIAVVLGVVFGYSLPHKHALEDAQASFQTASQKFTDAQQALTDQIQASSAASSFQETDVKDPTTISDLQAALANAQSLITNLPVMASTATEINQQVTDMTTQTTSMTAAAQTLQTAVTAIGQSRVDLAVDGLKTVLADAQSSYDSADWMATTTEGKTLLPQLKTLIDQATAATNDPSTLGADPDSIVSALQSLTPSLQQATDDLNAAAAKVIANKTYTYLLQGDQVSCGVNICYTGVGGGDPSTVESVQVTVKGSTVTAKLCFISNVAVDPATCQPTPGTQANLYGWSEAWTGTRDGTTVKIISTTKDKADFSWGTLTFASSAPNAEVTQFAAADSCEKSDGSGYGQ
ncbi:MAG: hypothetical protein FWD63_07785, partial [Propionibacteriaceae bacterium]|nr:hypothetical protein [Propionibacteriaceae bacterium]